MATWRYGRDEIVAIGDSLDFSPINPNSEPLNGTEVRRAMDDQLATFWARRLREDRKAAKGKYRHRECAKHSAALHGFKLSPKTASGKSKLEREEMIESEPIDALKAYAVVLPERREFVGSIGLRVKRPFCRRKMPRVIRR